MQLEIKHLAPYLPYGLKVRYLELDSNGMQEGGTANLQGLYCDDDIATFSDCMDYYFGQDNDVEIKPILRPLSDLDTDSISNECASIMNFVDYTHWPYGDVVLFFAGHFDIFGLINEGLAISIHDV